MLCEVLGCLPSDLDKESADKVEDMMYFFENRRTHKGWEKRFTWKPM